MGLLGGFLIGRTLAVLLTMTLGTSMAARQGTVAMAAHQICLQVWLAVSLLTDALGAATQVRVKAFIPPAGLLLCFYQITLSYVNTASYRLDAL